MKKLTLLLSLSIFLFCLPCTVKSQYLKYEPIGPINQPLDIEDGWYKATVKYYNAATYYKARYSLKVKVSYGRVTVIDFGNGGSIHSGYNNEGYIYSGGTLDYSRDREGNIVAASTRVTSADGTEYKYYDIEI